MGTHVITDFLVDIPCLGLHWTLLNFILFIPSLAVLGLGCCAGFSLDAASEGYPVELCRLLLAGASLVAEPRGEVQGLRSHGTRAQLLHSMRDPPGSGVERVSPASQGGF